MFSIPLHKLKEGALKCRENAVKIAECVLSISDSYPTVAHFLMILAFEEIGKGISLIEKYEKGDDLTENEWRKLSKDARAHIKKLKIVHRALQDPYSLLKPHDLSARLNDIEQFRHIASEVARQIHSFKLEAIYVNWNENECEWETPFEQITFNSEMLGSLVASTRLLSQKLREFENPNA